jgi:hypothetical protein
MIKLEKYRDRWLAEGFEHFVGFYNREFYLLDNFSAFSIKVDGITFPTVEHAYQAAKFVVSCPKTYMLVREAPSAYDAQRIAREFVDRRDPKFDEYKIQLMEKLLRAKLEQHPHVRNKLLRTRGHTIAEDSPDNDFWGIGANRNGKNIMGKLWMKLRDEILANTVDSRD